MCTHPTSMKTAAPLVELPCTCATLRRATRSLTMLYDKELRPTGLKSTQFTVLQVLDQAGPVNQKTLGHILALDSTSLTRALTPLERQGWIKRRRGEDRRRWLLDLSPTGRAQLRRALPRWQKLQHRLQQHLGPELWARISQTSNDLISQLPQGESQ